MSKQNKLLNVDINDFDISKISFGPLKNSICWKYNNGKFIKEVQKSFESPILYDNSDFRIIIKNHGVITSRIAYLKQLVDNKSLKASSAMLSVATVQKKLSIALSEEDDIDNKLIALDNKIYEHIMDYLKQKYPRNYKRYLELIKEREEQINEANQAEQANQNDQMNAIPAVVEEPIKPFSDAFHKNLKRNIHFGKNDKKYFQPKLTLTRKNPFVYDGTDQKDCAECAVTLTDADGKPTKHLHKKVANSYGTKHKYVTDILELYEELSPGSKINLLILKPNPIWMGDVMGSAYYITYKFLATHLSFTPSYLQMVEDTSTDDIFESEYNMDFTSEKKNETVKQKVVKNPIVEERDEFVPDIDNFVPPTNVSSGGKVPMGGFSNMLSTTPTL